MPFFDNDFLEDEDYVFKARQLNLSRLTSDPFKPETRGMKIIPVPDVAYKT